MKAFYYLLKGLLQIAYTLHPHMGNRLALRLFTRPLFQIKKEEELLVLRTAETEKIPFEEESIQVYRFGHGLTPILLIHGWRGHAGNFMKIIHAFDLNQYHLVAFDAPAHNASTGSRTNVIQIARLTKELIMRYRPKHIIAHSMGSAVAVTALRELATHPIERAVLLSTPNSLSYLVESFTKEFRFSSYQRDTFYTYFQSSLSRNFEELKIQNQIQALSIQVLLIHDRYDRVLPIEEAMKVTSAYQDKTKIVLLDKVGHYKMLSDAQTIEKTKLFINGKDI